jgi:hypothetical protein
MAAYPTRREKQEKREKQEPLIRCLAGPLRRYLPDAWIREAGGLAERVSAFPPGGHGVVHGSSGAVSGSVLPGHAGLASDGSDGGWT